MPLSDIRIFLIAFRIRSTLQQVNEERFVVIYQRYARRTRHDAHSQTKIKDKDGNFQRKWYLNSSALIALYIICSNFFSVCCNTLYIIFVLSIIVSRKYRRKHLNLIKIDPYINYTYCCLIKKLWFDIVGCIMHLRSIVYLIFILTLKNESWKILFIAVTGNFWNKMFLKTLILEYTERNRTCDLLRLGSYGEN